MSKLLERLIAWIDSLSDTIKPAAYGALAIVMLMMLHGAWLTIPIGIAYVLIKSHTPGADLARGAAAVTLAMVGGAFSGLAYGLVGRHVRDAFPGGRYVSGIVTAAPYMCVLYFIIKLLDRRPSPLPASVQYWIIGGMTLFVGLVIGHFWFVPDQAVMPPAARPRNG